MSDIPFEDLFAEPEGWWWRHVERHFWRVYRALRRAKEGVEEWWQRRTIGYAYVEAWNLCDYLARYALPRVRHIRDEHMAYPLDVTPEKWQTILDDIVYALEVKVGWDFGDGSQGLDFEDDPRYQRGLKLFGEWWQHLWD